MNETIPQWAADADIALASAEHPAADMSFLARAVSKALNLAYPSTDSSKRPFITEHTVVESLSLLEAKTLVRKTRRAFGGENFAQSIVELAAILTLEADLLALVSEALNTKAK